MTSRTGYIIRDQYATHFLTFTAVEWIDVFSRCRYRKLLVDSLRHCQQNKGLVLYAYVIMTNHVHLVCRTRRGHQLSDFVRDFKKYTARAIIRSIRSEPESRRSWLLQIMRKHGRRSSNHKSFKLWQRNSHPVEMRYPSMLYQRINYVHKNPVKAGIVARPEHYLYSSASNYCGAPSILEVEVVSFEPSIGQLY